MVTSGLGPDPERQSSPNPNSPPGVPAATPIPASAITSTPTDTPEGREKIERYKRYIYNGAIGMTVFIPVLIAAPPRKYDFFTYGLGIVWVNSVGYIVEAKTGQGLIWHIGTKLPSEANRQRRARMREEENVERRAKGLPERKRGVFEGLFMGKEREDWREKRMQEEDEALKEGGKGYSGLITDQVKEVLGFREFKDDDDDDKESNIYGKKDDGEGDDKKKDD
ncbi:MAG: hypothetical protein M1828_006053 [Chrysothrix sp. TS-e1954]|nr:MAG: hypothetical protein M1828_006053 [Chrysothrix sp. TS-e1954]